MKRSEVYPDSVDSDDCIKFTYNRQGQVTAKTDQNGTVHSFDFDKLGRGTEDRVTNLASGVDGAVLRIEKTFEVRGMVQHITSYDNATVGSGAIVNDVLFAYNSFGQVTADYQSHSGAVNVASTPKVQYAYLSGSANSIRPTSMTYPNSRVLTYSYGTAGGANDALSRISALVDNDGTTQLAAYQYLGLGAFVEVDYTEPDIKYTLIDLSSTNDPDTGDIYSGLDRFSRVKDCRWYNYGTIADTARIKHGYDRAGNRLYREDPVAASYGKAFDELYTYDGIYRLRDMQRGTLNGSKTAIAGGTKTFEQCWTLDATGNWQGFREDSDGNSSWDLVQARTDNKVNELTGVTNTVGSAWAAPAYNRNGNMTTVPQPADPTKGYIGTFDAWNRLVKLVDVPTSQTVQENAYDGRTFRVARKTYTGGILSETRHLFYSTGWQVVEERVESATTAERQPVWGLRYIDDLVVRNRDTTGGGTLNERLYPAQDANWNVVAIASTVGVVQERCAYSAYGHLAILTATFAPRATSINVWDVFYCGYRWDSSTSLYLLRNRTYSAKIG
ncbi:MAG: RHS repeat-associated core domain-containing protein, partial [Planctomycetota bacterium]|nr:RHS repeat-associated core domain-containing protein [Planctomycetota bacterium]